MAEHRLNAKGLICPMPVLKAQKVMKSLNKGELLILEATDPAAPKDVRAFCEAQGHELLSEELSGSAFIFTIRKGLRQ